MADHPVVWNLARAEEHVGAALKLSAVVDVCSEFREEIERVHVLVLGLAKRSRAQPFQKVPPDGILPPKHGGKDHGA